MNQNFEFYEKLMFVLYFSKNYKSNIIRLMKLLFVFDEIFELRSSNKLKELDFKGHHYGPWADNYDAMVNTLITSNLINYQEFKKQKIYSLNIERNDIKNLIQNEYFKNEQYKAEIDLIKIFSSKYLYSNDIIYFVYTMRPNFTQNSVIKSDVKDINPKINQEIIIELIEEIDLVYLLKLFSEENIPKILDIYEFTSKKADYLNISQFIYHLINTIDQISDYYIEETIELIDNLALDEGEELKHFKLALLSLFEFSSPPRNEKFIRYLLVFIFRSFQLKSPLNKQDFNEFNIIFDEFKEKIGLESSFDYILIPKTSKKKIHKTYKKHSQSNLSLKISATIEDSEEPDLESSLTIQ